MGKCRLLILAAAAAMAAACSGGSEETLVSGAGGAGAGGGQTAAEIGNLTLLTSSPQIPSDGSSEATVTALVRDVNNNVMDGVSVVFTASSGSLVVTQPAVSDESGVVSATLSTGGDPTVRDIEISGLAGGSVESFLTVGVDGVTVSIDGPSSLSTGADGTYTVRVLDAPVSGDVVPDATVEISSASGNPLSQETLTTDNKGEATFTLTASNPGTDTLTATSFGASSDPLEISVSGDSFMFTSPDPSQPAVEVPLGTALPIEVVWETNGAGVPNQPVTFATSRGTVSSASELTDSSGAAAITVSSANAGPAVVTATNDDGTSIQLGLEFVATTPNALDLQADPGTIATEAQSTITAVVRDANGNLVKNQVVSFVLEDVTGGSLSVAQSTTNSQGRAQTVYSASTATSSSNGVKVRAEVQGAANVNDEVALTVAQRELFISIGTGNEIEEPNTAQYRKEWIVQVTDSQGNGVPEADVTFSVLSTRYWDGERVFPAGGSSWETVVGPPGGCTDEDTLTGSGDYDRNGILDNEDDNGNGTLDPGEDDNGNGILDNEDFNGNGQLEAGNIASAVPQGSSGNTLTTDGNGFGIIEVFWPQEFAYYLEVTLEARTSVQGSEFAETTTFVVPGSSDDFSDEDVAPPGPVSPFGVDQDCGTPPPN